MRVLTLLIATAAADVATPPPNPCDEREQGDSCTTEEGDDGTCKGGTCVADSDESGCSTLGARTAAGGATLLALGLLAVGRRRS